jgi:serine/threonine-protein kinase HipA
MLYTSTADARLSPMFDVVTTAIYPFERPGGVMDVDRTLALKWRSGKRHACRAYPTTEELLSFGRSVCSVAHPKAVLQRIADAMGETLKQLRTDERVDKDVLRKLTDPWKGGQTYAH